MKFPHQYIDFQYEDGRLKGDVLQPVALLSDIETIMGQKATHVKEKHYTFKFTKEVKKDRNPWFIHLWVNKKNQIVGFQFPRKLGKVFGKEVLINAIRAVGYAEVSIRKKTVYLKMKDTISRKQVIELMGASTSVDKDILKYHYKNGEAIFYTDFIFKEHLKLAKMYSNGFNLEVSFGDS